MRFKITVLADDREVKPSHLLHTSENGHSSDQWNNAEGSIWEMDAMDLHYALMRAGALLNNECWRRVKAGDKVTLKVEVLR
ncbi:MAG: hypothetical protein KGL39_16495 [Patescibacteria group bacterium]|nr:hypothetical protein [Patescibacteria group bacterium]